MKYLMLLLLCAFSVHPFTLVWNIDSGFYTLTEPATHDGTVLDTIEKGMSYRIQTEFKGDMSFNYSWIIEFYSVDAPDNPDQTNVPTYQKVLIDTVYYHVLHANLIESNYGFMYLIEIPDTLSEHTYVLGFRLRQLGKSESSIEYSNVIYNKDYKGKIVSVRPILNSNMIQKTPDIFYSLDGRRLVSVRTANPMVNVLKKCLILKFH